MRSLSNSIRVAQFTSVVIRGSSLIIRFGLTLLLVYYFQPKEIGVFGLYWSAIILATSFMGLDVYSNSVRRILKNKEKASITLSNHLGFMVAPIVLFIPSYLLLNIFYQPVSSKFLLVLFPFHLVIEYISTETNRFLVPLERVLQSTIIMFIKSSAWIPVAALIMYFNESSRSIELVITCWLVGSILSTILSLKVLLAYINEKKVKFNSKWVVLSIQSSIIFFLSTILFRLLISSDRFIINNFLTLEDVGIYTIFSSLAMSMLTLLEIGVSAWHYPSLIRSQKNNECKQFVIKLKYYFRDVFIGGISISLIFSFLLPYVFKLLNKNEYLASINTLYILLLGVFIYSLSMPFHYIIYGSNNDRKLIYIYFISFVIFIALSKYLLLTFGVAGAAILFSIGLTSIAILRFLFSISTIISLRSS